MDLCRYLNGVGFLNMAFKDDFDFITNSRRTFFGHSPYEKFYPTSTIDRMMTVSDYSDAWSPKDPKRDYDRSAALPAHRSPQQPPVIRSVPITIESRFHSDSESQRLPRIFNADDLKDNFRPRVRNVDIVVQQQQAPLLFGSLGTIGNRQQLPSAATSRPKSPPAPPLRRHAPKTVVTSSSDDDVTEPLDRSMTSKFNGIFSRNGKTATNKDKWFDIVATSDVEYNRHGDVVAPSLHYDSIRRKNAGILINGKKSNNFFTDSSSSTDLPATLRKNPTGRHRVRFAQDLTSEMDTCSAAPKVSVPVPYSSSDASYSSSDSTTLASTSSSSSSFNNVIASTSVNGRQGEGVGTVAERCQRLELRGEPPSNDLTEPDCATIYRCSDPWLKHQKKNYHESPSYQTTTFDLARSIGRDLSDSTSNKSKDTDAIELQNFPKHNKLVVNGVRSYALNPSMANGFVEQQPLQNGNANSNLNLIMTSENQHSTLEYPAFNSKDECIYDYVENVVCPSTSFCCRPEHQQTAYDESGHFSNQLPSIDEESRQILQFYAPQIRSQNEHLTKVIDDFLSCVEFEGTSPRDFVTHGRFLVLAAHKLVYLGDSLCHCLRPRTTEIADRLGTPCDRLCNALRNCVEATKKACATYPFNTADAKLMVDSVALVGRHSADLAVDVRFCATL